jgi:urease accessory protein
MTEVIPAWPTWQSQFTISPCRSLSLHSCLRVSSSYGYANGRHFRKTTVALPAAELQRARGDLRLRFKQQDGRTRLGDLYQRGCLKARFPTRSHAHPLEAVSINTSGGLTDDDKLETLIHWDAGTSGLVTSQAAERVYHCRVVPALINTTLTVGDEATACWLPQETILFNESRLQRTTTAELGVNAQLFAVESLIFGRIAMREELRSGYLFDQFRIYQRGQLVFSDAMQLSGDENDTICAQLQRRSMAGAARCVATLLFAGNTDADLLGRIRLLIDDCTVTGGASDLGPVIVMRIIADDSKLLRESILKLYIACLGGAGFSEPRVWHC